MLYNLLIKILTKFYPANFHATHGMRVALPCDLYAETVPYAEFMFTKPKGRLPAYAIVALQKAFTDAINDDKGI